MKHFTVLFVACSVLASPSAAQIFYTHSSPSQDPIVNDGFPWPESPGVPGGTGLLDQDGFETPDGITYYNYSGNSTFFDANYQAAGNSSVIDGEAWWGNPRTDCCESVSFEMYNAFEEVSEFSFDIAVALASGPAPSFIELEAYNIDGESTFLSFDLTPFDPGPVFQGFTAYEGRVTVYADDLPPFFYDDEELEPMFAIGNIDVYLDGVVTPGGVGEFAIDNVSVNGSLIGPEGDGVYPESFDGSHSPLFGWGTRWLKSDHTYNVTQSVFNSNNTPSTYSIELTGDFTPEPGLSNRTIGPQESENVLLSTIDLRTAPSGSFEANARFVNHTDPEDPDDDLSITFALYDPAVLSDNSADTFTGGGMTIQNASNLSHPGALRAGAEITGIETDIAGFAVDGFEVGSFIAAGETLTAVPAVDLDGDYEGTFTVHMKMNSEGGSFLNARPGTFEPLESIVWNVSFSTNGVDFDFNDDGSADIIDLDLLVEAIAENDIEFDLDGSGTVDKADISTWLDGVGSTRFGESYLFGDLDLDGDVDSADLNRVGLNWQQPASGWSAGDTNGDRRVDSEDLNTIALNWQQSVASPAAVPEPTNWLLQLPFVGVLLSIRRRRSAC